jgi:outer membrane protein assembly factor BamB
LTNIAKCFIVKNERAEEEVRQFLLIEHTGIVLAERQPARVAAGNPGWGWPGEGADMHGALTLLLGVRKRLPTIVGVVSALLLLVSMEVAASQRPCGTASQKCAWPQFHHDTTNAGFTSSRGPRIGEIVWSADVQGYVETSPIVVGDKVIVGTLDGLIYALNEADGSVLWIFSVPSRDPLVKSTCLYRAGKVFYATFDGGHTYALNAATGEPLWSSDVIAKAWMGSPALAGDLLFVPDTRGAMAAFDALSGAEVWRFELPVNPYILAQTGPTRRYRTYSSPAVDSELNRVFFGSYYAAVHCLDLRDGTTIWENQIGYPFLFAPNWGLYYYGSRICDGPAVADGLVYIGAGRYVYAFDAYTGANAWSCQLMEARTSDPDVYATFTSSPVAVNDYVYIGAATDEGGKVLKVR